MKRRDKAGGKAAKAQRRKTMTRRNAPKGARGRNPLTTDKETNVARLTRELFDAREQQMATAEILRVIRASPADAQPVFETIVRNAVPLCGSLFANVFRFDGELLHFVAGHNVGPSYVELLRAKYPMRPDFSQISGRVLLTKSVVRLEDVLADPDYDQRFPRPWAGGECWECQCCARAIRLASLWSAGPSPDPCRDHRDVALKGRRDLNTHEIARVL